MCKNVHLLLLSGGDVEEEEDSDEDSDEESDRDDEDYEDSEAGAPLDDSVCPPGKINIVLPHFWSEFQENIYK